MHFEGLSLGRFAIFGAIGGALASSFPATTDLRIGFSQCPHRTNRLLLGPLCVCGAVAASSHSSCKNVEDRDLLDAKRDTD